jgi:hypothetical protein
LTEPVKGTQPVYFPVTKFSFCAMLSAVTRRPAQKRRRSDGSQRSNYRTIFHWGGCSRGRSSVCFNTNETRCCPQTSTEVQGSTQDNHFSQRLDWRPLGLFQNHRHRQIHRSSQRHQSFHPRRSLVLKPQTVSSSQISLTRSSPMGGAGAALRLLSLVRWNGSLKQRTAYD